MLMLTGTYTRNTDAEGVYAFRCDAGFRRFERLVVNTNIDNPSYLVRHPTLDVVYGVNEVGDFEGGGGISTFNCDAGGKLDLVGKVASMGADPCHLMLGRSGRSLFVSNYSGGNLTSFAIDDGGRLGDFESLVQHGGKGVDPMRQKGPHVHSVCLAPGGEHAFVCDLGLDQVVHYPVKGARILVERRTTTRMRPGAGPRMMTFDHAGEFAWVINELDNTIVSFAHNGTGELVELQTVSALPPGFTDASYTSHLVLSDDGRFLYGSNRGHDSIVVFAVEAEGRLRLVQHEASRGMHPRHFALTPDGSHMLVANRDSNNIVVFERDAATGRLAATGAILEVPAPVCVVFMPPR